MPTEQITTLPSELFPSLSLPTFCPHSSEDIFFQAGLPVVISSSVMNSHVRETGNREERVELRGWREREGGGQREEGWGVRRGRNSERLLGSITFNQLLIRHLSALEGTSYEQISIKIPPCLLPHCRRFIGDHVA